MKHKQAQVLAALVSGAGVVDSESDRAKPLSSVFGFEVQADSNFQKRVVRFVSDYARQRLGLSTFKSLYSIIIGNTDPGKSVENGRIFETMVFRLLHGDFKKNSRPRALSKWFLGARTGTVDVASP